jgi:hypothetical protein
VSDYETTYQQWVESLSPEERRKLEEAGCDTPYDDHNQVSGHLGEDEDPASLAVGTVVEDRSISDWLADNSFPPHLADELIEQVQAHLEREQTMHYAQGLNRILGELLATPNVRLSCAGLCFALNLDAVNGLGTMAQAARQLCVTRASISKAAQRWRDLLGESHISPHLKSKEARAAYSISQKQKHWRRQCWTR